MSAAERGWALLTGGRPRPPGGPRRLAVVLSGGGTRGAFQAGVVDVVARRGLVPDLLVGTSVGALNAAYWALHPEPDAGEGLRRLWDSSDPSLLVYDRIALVRGLLGRRRHLLARGRLETFLADALGRPYRIEELPIPLAVTTTELRTGRRVVLRRGPLLPALLASTAVPGVFDPVRVDGMLLADGGVVANCDIMAAVEDGATDVVAISLLGDMEAPEPAHLLDVVELTTMAALRRQSDLTFANAAGKARVAMLRSTIADRHALSRFDCLPELFAAGREAATRFLDDAVRHRRVTPGIYSCDGAPPARPEAANGAAHPPPHRWPARLRTRHP